MVGGFPTIYAISAYHHWSCEFESRSGEVYWSRTNYRQVSIIANSRTHANFRSNFLKTIIINGDKTDNKILHLYLGYLKKKSGKTPLETIPLYINLVGSHVNGADLCQSLLLTEKNIADWCWSQNTGDTFIYCGIKAISFNFTVDLYLYFPTSNKMAIIGTLPTRFSDKNQQLYWYEHAHKNYLYFRPREVDW